MSDLAPVVGLVIIPLVFWAWALTGLVRDDNIAYDFHHYFYPQARDLIHGRIPATAYPPLATLLYVPLAVLPRLPADLAVTAVMIGCAAGTLWVLEVRDWRCYGAIALWEPVYTATQTANLSLIFALGLAFMWRWRDHRVVAGAVVAAMVAMKLFLWPVAGWLWVTGRRRAVLVMLAAGLVASAAAWSLIGFATLRHFPELIRGNVHDNGNKPYTIAALARLLGADDTVAYGATWTVGLAVLAAGLRLGARGREIEALALTIAAALLLSPIVWVSYLSLLLIPMALSRPHFDRVWLTPMAFWLVAPYHGSIPSTAFVLVCAATIFGLLAGARHPLRRLETATP